MACFSSMAIDLAAQSVLFDKIHVINKTREQELAARIQNTKLKS